MRGIRVGNQQSSTVRVACPIILLLLFILSHVYFKCLDNCLYIVALNKELLR